MCYTAVQNLISSFGPDEFDETKVCELLRTESNAAFKDPSQLNDYLVAQFELIDQAERKNRTSGKTRKEEREMDKTRLQNITDHSQTSVEIDNYVVENLSEDLEEFVESLVIKGLGGGPTQSAGAGLEPSALGERVVQLNTPIHQNEDGDM